MPQTTYQCSAYHMETFVAHKDIKADDPQQAMTKLKEADENGDLDLMDYCDSEPPYLFTISRTNPEGCLEEVLSEDVDEHNLTAQAERARQLSTSLRDILSRFKSCIAQGNGEIEGDKEAIAKAETLLKRIL